MLNFIALTDKGLVRGNNEDSYGVDKEKRFFLLADGMGGHKAGEIASRIAVETLTEDLQNSVITTEDDLIEILIKSVKRANEKIFNLSVENNEYRGMGTTLSLIYVFDEYIYYLNIGDSRIYEISSEEIKKLTRDDSFVNYLIEIGEINEEEAKTHPKKNVLTKALGTSENLEVHVEKEKIDKNHKYLVCSDGLTNMVEEKEIFEVTNQANMEKSAKVLLNKALENGGIDNITLILIYNE
ncbi:Stp1/IreP family PP2C-type Ser/Thr phosphatase [Peptoniphilus catoniae]|uniref:Stp1/IreP family PP2C-type Ser/Thr phosphatase n=1 Tax=Peptoniphilus catoniae TaxID=1660341 RepID=UPI0010FDBC22|nr:Stp1/IreP family PP2C-type Ser/Thr phosphatase [Peptoniphilus catoniae]